MKKIFALAMLVGALVSPVTIHARELTSGGTTGGGNVMPACSPVNSLSVKGDARVGETGLASVEMSWSVKPCDKAQSVRVVAEVINWKTQELMYQDTNALLSGKATVYIPNRQLYTGKITVLDTLTGEVLGTKSFTVSTTPKGV